MSKPVSDCLTCGFLRCSVWHHVVWVRTRIVRKVESWCCSAKQISNTHISNAFQFDMESACMGVRFQSPTIAWQVRCIFAPYGSAVDRCLVFLSAVGCTAPGCFCTRLPAGRKDGQHMGQPSSCQRLNMQLRSAVATHAALSHSLAPVHPRHILRYSF